MTSSSALLSLLVIATVAQLAQAQVSGGAAGAIVDAHNRLRRSYGINQMVSWSGSLAGYAQGRANFQARSCRLDHGGLRRGTGENLAMGSGSGDLNNIMRLVGLWVAEGPSGGHWKQMAWAQTTEVGCAISFGCGATYLACNYNPPGSVGGQNVWTGNPNAPRPPPPPPVVAPVRPPPPPAATTTPPAPEATPAPSATPTPASETPAAAAPSEAPASPAPATPEQPKGFFDFSMMFPPALPGDSTSAAGSVNPDAPVPAANANANAGGSQSSNKSGGRIAGGSNTDENGRVTLSSDLQSSASGVVAGVIPAVAAVVVAGVALFA